MADVLTETQVKERLKDRYAPPEWFFAEEVGMLGVEGYRRADAVAVNLYRSRDHRIESFEIKTSRADFLQELKDGSKAEAFYCSSDVFWLVLGDRDIWDQDKDIIPESWGIMGPWGDTLRQMRKPKIRKQKHLDREFWASMIGKSLKFWKESEAVDEARQEAYKRGRKYGQEDLDRTREQLKEKRATLRRLTKLLDTYGVEYRDEEELVKAIEEYKAFRRASGQIRAARQRLERAKDLLGSKAEDLEEAIEELDAHMKEES